MKLVADTSGLVSIASSPEARQQLLPLLLDSYEVTVPQQVIDELDAVAGYDDDHATAASAVLDSESRLTVATVELDSTFPLDDGENAVVQLANDLDAPFCYCDEYNQLSLIHASLSATRLVTTPRLLKAFVVHGLISNDTAAALLDDIASVRSWTGNAYVQQATQLFEGPE
jgi:rRNA-processing protein FCF1